MEQLLESVLEFSDEYLLDQYRNHAEEYTEEALKVLAEEIERRKLGDIEIKKSPQKEKKSSTFELDSEEFEELDHSFSHTDLLLAVAMLKENEILFFIHNTGSDTLPLESEATVRFSIHVHKSMLNKAEKLIEEHFEKSNGRYILKYKGARERLKAFSFSDVHINEKQAKEKIEVVLTDEEKKVIVTYGNRLLKEADQIEQDQQRVLFYYDCIEEVLADLVDNEKLHMTRSDLLTILEILQVYCEEPGFPSNMDEMISSLLKFFIGT